MKPTSHWTSVIKRGVLPFWDNIVLAAAVGNHYAAIVQHRRDLNDAAHAAANEAAFEAIDVAAGWPAS